MAEKIIGYGGPILVGAVAGFFYGLTKEKMREPLPAHTRGWTPRGSKIKLTQRVACHPGTGDAFLVLADAGAKPHLLRRAMTHTEQALSMGSFVDRNNQDELRPKAAEILAFLSEQRTLTYDALQEALENVDVSISERAAVEIVDQTLGNVEFNVRMRLNLG